MRTEQRSARHRLPRGRPSHLTFGLMSQFEVERAVQSGGQDLVHLAFGRCGPRAAGRSGPRAAAVAGATVAPFQLPFNVL